jgi:hypothetical protein
MPTDEKLRAAEFDASQRVEALRRAVFEQGRHDQAKRLADAETDLTKATDARIAAERQLPGNDGVIVGVQPESNLLGPETTGLEVAVKLRMTSVPTALVHLFTADTHPLVSFDVRNRNDAIKRLRLISYVEGFSARAVTTIEVKKNVPLNVAQLPTFFPQQLAAVTELTRASVNVEVQDLDAKTEVHETTPIWLLARTTAPLQALDPASGKWTNLTSYLGAFVTPNAPAVMEFLGRATALHPTQQLVGYQGDAAVVAAQVKAAFEALKAANIRYVNSVIQFTPGSGSNNQRVRLPRETLAQASSNCIDGTLVMASLLEAMSLNPGIVIVPGHAFLAWETKPNSGQWSYVETTMIGTSSFEDACKRCEATVQALMAAGGEMKVHSVRALRAQGITPLE